jgi:hypothetical protein
MLSDYTFAGLINTELEFAVESDERELQRVELRLLREARAARRGRERRPMSPGRPLHWRQVARLRAA